jgi:hypothetical protein
MLNVTDADGDNDDECSNSTADTDANADAESRNTDFLATIAAKSSDSILSWDKFEYSTSPKIDTRFGTVQYNHTNTTELPKEELLEQLHQQETIFDQEYSQVVTTQNQLWRSIPPETVQIATNFLQPYIQPERIRRIQTVLQQRTQNVRFLFESKYPSELMVVVSFHLKEIL